jgi:hypothetical protein
MEIQWGWACFSTPGEARRGWLGICRVRFKPSAGRSRWRVDHSARLGRSVCAEQEDIGGHAAVAHCETSGERLSAARTENFADYSPRYQSLPQQAAGLLLVPAPASDNQA